MHYSRKISELFQGALEVNEVVPLFFLIISISLVRFLPKKLFISSLSTLAPNFLFMIVALSHVEDLHLFIINREIECTFKAIEEAQAIVGTWYAALKLLEGKQKHRNASSH